MSSTINLLKSKAKQLHSKLRLHGIALPKSERFHLLAYIVGEGCWDKLLYNYKFKPGPHTNYQPCPHALKLAISNSTNTQISFSLSQHIIDEIRWPSEYVPVFNILPISEDGEVLIPAILIQSHIFSSRKKRISGCLQKRIAVFDHYCNISKDIILYTGETLNHYDRVIFYSLLIFHPADTPVGREYPYFHRELEKLYGRNFCTKSVLNSLTRMKDCKISIPIINYFGPLISYIRKQKNNPREKPAYKLALNPQFTKFYRDRLYSQFMDGGNLFHHRPNYDSSIKTKNYWTMKQQLEDLKKQDFIEHSKQLGELWPTHDSDIAAIYAIIATNACSGSAQFKLIEDVNFLDNDVVEIRFPDWYNKAISHFIDLYGPDAGSIIFEKAVSRFTAPLFGSDSQ